MSTTEKKEVQVAGRVSPTLRREMFIALLQRDTDFTAWLNDAMARYVEETKLITMQPLDGNSEA